MAEQKSANIKNPARWLMTNVWDRLPDPSSVPNRNIIGGWAMTFRLSPGDCQVFRCLRAIEFMMQRAKNKIQEMGFSEAVKARHLGWVPAFQDGLNKTAAGHAWEDLYRGFSSDRRIHLEYAMHWLDDTASPDNVMTQSDLDGLIQSIDALRKEIASATDLEADFKALLLDMVEALRRALSEYQIRGASGVDDALGEIMGRLLVHLKVVQENSKSPWFRRVFDAAMKVIKFGADAKDTKEVLGGFGQLLLEVVK